MAEKLPEYPINNTAQTRIKKNVGYENREQGDLPRQNALWSNVAQEFQQGNYLGAAASGVVALGYTAIKTAINSLRDYVIKPVEQAVVKNRQDNRIESFSTAKDMIKKSIDHPAKNQSTFRQIFNPQKDQSREVEQIMTDIRVSHVLSKATDKIYAAFEANPRQITPAHLSNFAKDLNVNVEGVDQKNRSDLMKAIKDRLTEMVNNMNSPEFMHNNRDSYSKLMGHARGLYKKEFIQDSTKLENVSGISFNPVTTIKAIMNRDTRTTDKQLLSALRNDNGLASFQKALADHLKPSTPVKNNLEQILKSSGADQEALNKAIETLKNAGVGESKLTGNSILPNASQKTSDRSR